MTDKKTRTRRKRHNHASFVFAVLTRYRFGSYEDREVHPGKIGEGIRFWSEDDRTLAIEEGRRQLDEQFAQERYVTSRASILLPVGIALSAYLLTGMDDVDVLSQPARTIALVLLSLGSAMAIWGSVIMAALIGGRARFKTIDAAQLTTVSGGLRKYLARDYAECVPTGENTNAARLTHLGTGVTWIVVGAFLGAIGLALSQWGPMQAVPVPPC